MQKFFTRWLVVIIGLLCSLAASAHNFEVGEFAYTKVAKYKITGNNLVTNGTFSGDDITAGWVATDETNSPLATVFEQAADGGVQVISGQTALTCGMYQTVKIDAGGTYVVAFKVKGATAGFTDHDMTGAATNYINAYFNTDGALASVDGTNLLFGENGVNGGYQFSYNADDYTQVVFAVEAPQDGNIIIDFRGMAEGLAIADVECRAAEEVYDDRIANDRIAYFQKYLEGAEFEGSEYDRLQTAVKAVQEAIANEASPADMATYMENLENYWALFVEATFSNVIDLIPTTDGSANTGNNSANWMYWTDKYNKLNQLYNGKAPWSWSSDRWGHKTAAADSPMQIQWMRGVGANDNWNNVATLTAYLQPGTYYWGVTGQGGMMTLNRNRWARSWADECAATQLFFNGDTTEVFILNAARNQDYVFKYELAEADTITLGIICNNQSSSEKAGFDVLFYNPVLIKSTKHVDKQGVIYELNAKGDAFEVVGYTKSLVEDVVIPSLLYGLPIVGVRENALMGAEELKNITFPEGVTSIGDYALKDCSNLTSVSCFAIIPPELGSSCFDGVNKGICALYVPQISIDAYKAIDGWGQFLDVRPITERAYSVVYMVDEEVYFKQKIESGDSLTPIDEPIKEGYTFSGWGEMPEVMPAEDVTVTGTFIVNTYEVTYTIDGEVHATDSVTYGTAIFAPAGPAKEGYTLRWNGLLNVMPAYDVIAVGEYVVNRYKVTYMAGNDVCHTDSVAYGTVIDVPEAPAKEGYTFIEWEGVPETMPAKDITITGKYIVNTYKVTYTIDGEVYYTDSVTYGSTITFPDTPVKEGHTFIKWEGIPRTMPAKDLTLTGVFSANSYKVIYMIDNYVYRTESVVYGTPITPPDPPVSPGYEFSGWSECPATMPAQDLVITGVFWGSGLASIYTDEQGVVYNLNDDKETYVVASVTNTLVSDVMIPDEINDAPVTAINDKVFIATGSLKSVVIPASVTTVGDMTFYGCSNLLVVEWNTTAPVRAECFDEPSRHNNLLVFVTDAATPVTYEGNVIVDGAAEDIQLTGGLPLRNPREFIAREVTYTHEFTKRTKIGEASGWEALVLPFDVETIVSEKKGGLLPFGQADFSTSLPYWAASLQTDGTFAIVESIKANTPFIMEVPNGEEYEDRYNIEGTVTFSATDVTVQATTNSQQPSGNGYSLQASYEGLASSSGVYALNDEEYTAADGSSYLPGGVFVADSRDIRPFEAYVYSESASRAPYLRIGGKGTTGMEQFGIHDSESINVYDLTGRKVAVDNMRELPKGIYIVNGKKVVVK